MNEAARWRPPLGKECAMAIRRPRTIILFAVSAVLAGSFSLAFAGRAAAAGTVYYVNCAAASNGDGSLAAPWNNLGTVNGKAFARATACCSTAAPRAAGRSSFLRRAQV